MALYAISEGRKNHSGCFDVYGLLRRMLKSEKGTRRCDSIIKNHKDGLEHVVVDSPNPLYSGASCFLPTYRYIGRYTVIESVIHA
jgi:hypothetical protein